VVLAAEEDDLVLVQRAGDELDYAGIRLRADPDAGDLDADAAGDPADMNHSPAFTFRHRSNQPASVMSIFSID
jgi:hypothetical protein